MKRLFPALLAGLVAMALSACEHRQEGLYRFSKERPFLFDTASFSNALYRLPARSAVPICALHDDSAELCGSGQAPSLFVRKQDIRKLGPLEGQTWKIRHLEYDDGGLSVYFLLDEWQRNTSVRPAAWVEFDPDESVVRLSLTPAELIVQMAREERSTRAIEWLDWEQVSPERAVLTIKTPRSRGVVLDWKAPHHLHLVFKRTPAEPPVVVLDAGHGGEELGTCEHGTCEKERTLTTALRLRDLLVERGVRVLMTRDTDVHVPLEERIAFAEGNQVDLFVSLHFDNWQAGGTLAPPRGLGCFYQTWISRPAARVLCNASPLLSHSPGWVIRRSLYVLHSPQFPSVLLEVANLANRQDFGKVSDPARFDSMLAALADGIVEAVK